MKPFPYTDILYLSRPKSRHHGPMSQIARGAQFSPFAALRGYEEVVEEASYRDPQEITLAEEGIARLDECLRTLSREQDTHPRAIFTYVHCDGTTGHIEIARVEAAVKHISPELGTVYLTDGREVPISKLLNIELPT